MKKIADNIIASSKKAQSGNIFTVLIGAVALVGVIGVTSMNMLSGPVATSAKVMQKTMADSQISASNKTIILGATNQANGGDCEAVPDGFIEPDPWRNASTNGPDGVAGSNGGGFVPLTLGLSTIDPWGTEYGYCVWDVGTVDDAGCGGGTQLRLAGSPTPTVGDTDTQYVLALISAGSDRIFQTPCKDYVNGTTPILTATGDDIVYPYTYTEAATSGSSIWNIEVGSPTTVSVDKGVMFGSNTDVTICGASEANSMRYNPVSDEIEVCDGAGSWTTLGGSGGGVWTDNTTHISSDTMHVLNTGETMTTAGFTTSPLAFIWHQDKHAIRTGGYHSSFPWTEANIGDHSFSSGKWTNAVGASSFAAGVQCFALGDNSVVMAGPWSYAYGLSGIAIGEANTSRGDYSVAIGARNDITTAFNNTMLLGHDNDVPAGGLDDGRYAFGLNNTVSQEYAMALGYEAEASGIYSIAMGVGDATGTKPLVSGGNSVGIFMGDQSGADLSSASTMAVVGGDFVVGSTSLDLDADAGHHVRMFFDKSTGAFRAGSSSTTDWDSSNLGANSVAFGGNSEASGNRSFAAGWSPNARGDDSFVVGQSTAYDLYNIVMGTGNTVRGGYSVVIGRNNYMASAWDNSMLLGSFNNITAAGAHHGRYAFGRDNTVSQEYAMALGYEVEASGIYSVAISAGDATGTKPLVSGNDSIGIFMGDQSSVDVSAANTMAIMGGNVGIGMVNPSVELDVTGDIEFTGMITDVSDRRLKTDIKPLPKGSLDKISKLNTYSFRMKDDKKNQIEYGVMAQELEEVFPELVKTAKDEMGTKSVNYFGLIAPTIESIKQLKDKNSSLEDEIDILENQSELKKYIMLTLIAIIFGILAFGVMRQRKRLIGSDPSSV